MANRVEIQLGIKADVTQASQQLKSLQSQLNSLSKINTLEAEGFSKDLVQASNAALQLKQNIELTKSQFNMKLIGGLLFCLKSWRDSPSWIYDRLDKLEEDEDVLIPFLYSHLIELLVIARKEQSNIPILVRFASLMEKQQKFS